MVVASKSAVCQDSGEGLACRCAAPGPQWGTVTVAVPFVDAEGPG